MFLVIVLSALSQANAQIHRASSQSNYQIKYDSNFTLQYFLKKLQTQSTRDMFSLLDHYSFLAEASGGVRLIWITSVLAALLVGVCGVLPALLLPRLANDQRSLMDSAKFKLMMCFAAGSLLGDVFLHLLPEAYSTNVTPEQTANGLWTLFGVSVFFTVEKLFQDEETESDTNMQMLDENNNKLTKKSKQRKKRKSSDSNVVSIKILGLLNLFANIIDNFTHGIAVAGSFQASLKFGLCTLLATLLHEIPHELGDFVILLRSGLSYQQAALAQLLTGLGGVAGAIFSLSYSIAAEQAGDATCWILPFTSGGFLYISLANIVPEILRQQASNNPQRRQRRLWIESLMQIACFYLGIFIIYTIKILFD